MIYILEYIATRIGWAVMEVLNVFVLCSEKVKSICSPVQLYLVVCVYVVLFYINRLDRYIIQV